MVPEPRPLWWGCLAFTPQANGIPGHKSCCCLCWEWLWFLQQRLARLVAAQHILINITSQWTSTSPWMIVFCDNLKKKKNADVNACSSRKGEKQQSWGVTIRKYLLIFNVLSVWHVWNFWMWQHHVKSIKSLYLFISLYLGLLIRETQIILPLAAPPCFSGRI